MTYHPLTMRALRLYQDAAKARLPRIPDGEADDDYAGAAAFAASEPGARDPIVSLRAYKRKRCAELLAECRKIRSAMRRGTWQGDNGPLDLASAQESLWHRREDRRAFLAAAARAAALSSARVAQPVQQQQAQAGRPAAHAHGFTRGQRVRIRDGYEFSGCTRTGEVVTQMHGAQPMWAVRCEFGGRVHYLRPDGIEVVPAMVPQQAQQQQACMVSITWRNDNPNTIANRLATRLGREPTTAELCAEVKWILREARL